MQARTEFVRSVSRPWTLDRRWITPAVWSAIIIGYALAVSAVSSRIAALISLLSWGLGALAASIACLQTARASKELRSRAWGLFAAASGALVLQLLSVWISVGLGLGSRAPDVLLVFFAALNAAAIYCFRDPQSSFVSTPRRMVQVALINCAFTAACLAAFLEPALRHRGSSASLYVTFAQLIAFGVMFVMALYVLWSYRWSALRGSPLRVMTAVVLQAACGLSYVHAAYVHQGGPPVYVGAAWIASFGLLYWAAQDARRTPTQAQGAAVGPGVHDRLVDALLPTLLVLLMLLPLFVFRAQLTQRTLLLVGGLFVIFSIVLAAREMLVYYEEAKLEGELHQRGAELAQTREFLRNKTTALHETEQWLRIAADAGNVGLWAWDLVSNTVYYSPQWKRQLGYAENEISNVFDEWRSRLHPDDRERVMRTIDTFLKSSSVDHQVEFRLRHRDGTYRWILSQTTLLRGVDNRPLSMVGSQIDITRQKEAELTQQASSERHRERAGELEERVSERTRQLQEAYQQLESFAYAVAHDLKAPLRAMNGFSALLLESKAVQWPAQERGYAERIRAGSERMSTLIEGLLDYARLDRKTLHVERVSLRECIDAALQSCAADIDARRIAVRVTASSEQMNLDREALGLILRNLIENAVKFTRDAAAPAIEIGAEVNEQHALLWVKDNGIGFDPQYHDQIFAMFKRLHREDEYPGTGIGLALAAKAAQRLSGRLWAQSAKGAGATFFLELPGEGAVQR